MSDKTEDLTRVGPGTIMGNFMRQYWVPFAKSSELVIDGDPMRVMLLGEKLIAFRDTSGRVGLMDQRCPHRCVSLFLGRNEENGLRCIYHGWKFDADGNCVDMPSLPNSTSDIRSKIRTKAYKVVERGGLLWAYMGNQEKPPEMPSIEATMLAPEDAIITLVQRECNYLQALEADIDTSHFGFLHLGHINVDDVPPGHGLYNAVAYRNPEFKVIETPWGTSYGAFRPAGADQNYWRIANFMFPFWTQSPGSIFSIYVHARAWVPMDDEHTMFIHAIWKHARSPSDNRPLKNGKRIFNQDRTAFDYLPNTSDWFGRWKLAANPSNDWQIDRAAQHRGELFSGMGTIHLQDQSVTESMGPITDHDWEHLVATDQMIARTRRRLIEAAYKFQNDGLPPPGVADPNIYMNSRGGYFTIPKEKDWQEAYRDEVDAAVRPASDDNAAARYKEIIARLDPESL
jgi:phenylpropionate dioxygenase-like ring-hydroxylating dioxygenase large terminal subunit